MDVDSLVNPVVLERSNHLETGPVTDMSQTWVLVSTKVTLQNTPVLGTIEDCSPSLKFSCSSRRFLRVEFGHAPIVQVLSTPHSVGEMNFPIVSVINIG